METPLIYTHTYFLTAGETDVRGLMPLTLLVERLIETATEHANALGIGYDILHPMGLGWVLSRIAISIVRMPDINEDYTLTTWIEGSTRVTSNRCFTLSDAEGQPLAYIRTVWVAIDVERRVAGDLSMLDPDRFLAPEQPPCPVPRQRKIVVKPPFGVRTPYTFRYSDIDFNRHVNSVRYIMHILDLWDVDFHRSHDLVAFEISYLHECHADETAVLTKDSEPNDAAVGETFICHVMRDEATAAVSARLTFVGR